MRFAQKGLFSCLTPVCANYLALIVCASGLYTSQMLSRSSPMGAQCGFLYSKLRLEIKPLWSFQRFAARLITRSFKTAPTDSLLV
jgi:hypothetical protein